MEQAKQNSVEKEALLSESILKVMDLGVSKHFLDDSLTIIWGNAAFYKLLGYTENEFLLHFSGLKQYYSTQTETFETMKSYFLDACHAGKKSANYQIYTPVKNGRAIWLKVQGIFMRSPDDVTVMVYLVYSDITELLLQQEELCEIQEERIKNLKWLMSEYAGNVYVSDMDTYELLYVNKHACDTLQKLYQQLVGQKCFEVIQGRSSPCPFCTNAYLKKGETYAWEFFNPSLKRTFLIKDRMLDWEGHRARVELSYDMYSTEYKLAKKDQEREAILRTIPAGMIRIDARDYRSILWCNDIFLNMIGYTKQQFEEELHSQCMYMHSDDFERAVMLVQDLKNSGENVVFEARAYTRTKEERIWTVTLCYISGKDSWDGIPSYYSVGLDITEERKQIESLQLRAEKDALTGIYNRAETERQIKKYLADNSDSMGALFMIDTDNFKQINDTQGHMIGDVVLTEMASGMKKIMRDTDIVGRIGGDEFTVFMKQIPSPETAKKKADEMLYMFRHLFEGEKSPVKVTCSIGIAVYPQDGNTFKEIYASADKALYRAKSLGKNNYVIYDESLSQELGAFSDSSLGTAIDSEKRYAEGPDNVSRYIFRILYQMEEFDQAVNMVLEIVGKQFNVSRAYIFENSDDGRYGSNTFEWCNEGITPQIDNLQNANYQEYGDYASLFDDNLIFYCRDIYTLKPEHVALFSSQDIHSTLQCAFKNGSVLGGFVGFDECTGLRLWTQEEVSSLLLISQILSMFLQQKKAKKQLQEMQQYQAVLDCLDTCIYVVEAQTELLLYGNQVFWEEFPECKIGTPCHTARNLNQQPITWNQKAAYLCVGISDER